MGFRSKVGDILEINLSTGKKAFGQYIYRDPIRGSLLQVFDYFGKNGQSIVLESVTASKPLFPPIFTTILGGLKQKTWKVVGNTSIVNFTYPSFISTITHNDTLEATNWYLRNDKLITDLGKMLPDKYKNLEFDAIYSPDLVVKRIETGINIYEKLIKTNKYN